MEASKVSDISEKNITSELPGSYVRREVIPDGMTVKKAAEMMGIGRPALSNFLNGKSRLSQDMATRLEKAFGADKTALLERQQNYDFQMRKEDERRIAVRSYAPSFLNITATHIDAWADKIDARALLPALLRRLVHSTGSEISYSDFPAYDNSQRQGWDGKVKANNATPWVPDGHSGWEFGCNKDPQQKSTNDFSNRVKSIPKEERKNITFIFVTPHNWKSKDEWIKARKAKNEWKDVRAYDANDLEQWIELSASAQVWLADKIGIPSKGCQTLDDYWSFWSETADPPVSGKIFNSAIDAWGKTFTDWYGSDETNPLIVTAGSKDEALAFIAHMSLACEELKPFSERAVLVSSAESVRKIASISTEAIPIACSGEAERELVTTLRNRRAIVVAEKNIKGMAAHITVDPPSYSSFHDALTEMGFDDAQIDVHSSKSGKSPTILRRQLARMPAFKKPVWASCNDNIKSMIPLVFAGTWASDKDGDKEILATIAGKNYSDIERKVAYLASLDDAPIWVEGKYRGIISKLDCFHAISDQISEDDISNFFFVAEYVLSEDDPSLDLDKDERWMASVYNKVRDHSNAIRESICETLIILSVYGDGLFGKRLGIHIETRVALLIRKLLEDKTGRVWQSQQGELPKYAEAAPEKFLDIVENELLKDEPAFSSLFEPVDGGMFARCERTGMLWALELLTWCPERLSRVARVFAKLCEYDLSDNWSNKPIGSLHDIFLCWKPHTAASVEQRSDVLELLCREYPIVGWDLCMQVLKPGLSSTSGTYRPRWRDDAGGAANTVTDNEIYVFQKKCLDLVLAWPAQTVETLSDLVECFSKFDDESREKVSALIRVWLDSSPSDQNIARLREHIRRRTMTRRARKQGRNKANYVNGKKLYDLLEPQNLILKHRWLFAAQWVEYSPEELEDDLAFEKRDKWIEVRRVSALKEIVSTYGTDGAIELCLSGGAGFSIGLYLGRDILENQTLNEFVLKCLSVVDKENGNRIDSCLSGILGQMGDEERMLLLNSLSKKFAEARPDLDKLNRLLINAPFSNSTWDFIKTQEKAVQDKYWETVNPEWTNSSEELNYLVDKLLEVDRPRAVFQIVHLKPGAIETHRLIELLKEVATSASEPAGHYQVSSYEIEEALESLNARDDVDRMKLVELEYLYVEVLSPTNKYKVPNLSKEIARSPGTFMHLLALCFRRDDDGEDPKEWGVSTDADQRQSLARRAYSALQSASVIPGTQNDGTISVSQLREWILEVRKLAKEYGRLDIADEQIGHILSKSEPDEDGLWPGKEVREVFEDIASKHISIGMEVGLRNSRGAEWRGAGGSKERGLVDRYRAYAERVINKTPFVGRMLLNLAESYEREAEWHDTDDRVNARLRG